MRREARSGPDADYNNRVANKDLNGRPRARTLEPRAARDAPKSPGPEIVDEAGES
jgi:hypothetical protein